jgi:hypothetical protein
MREINTLLLILIGAILLWLAASNRLRNVPAAIQTLMGQPA